MKHRRRFQRGGQNRGGNQGGNANGNVNGNSNGNQGFPDDIQPDDVEGGDEELELSLSAEAHAGQPRMPAPQMSDDDENGGASSGAPPEPPKIIRVQDLKRMTARSEEHTSELQSIMRNSYAVVCLKKNT